MELTQKWIEESLNTRKKHDSTERKKIWNSLVPNKYLRYFFLYSTIVWYKLGPKKCQSCIKNSEISGQSPCAWLLPCQRIWKIDNLKLYANDYWRVSDNSKEILQEEGDSKYRNEMCKMWKQETSFSVIDCLSKCLNDNPIENV